MMVLMRKLKTGFQHLRTLIYNSNNNKILCIDLETLLDPGEFAGNV